MILARQLAGQLTIPMALLDARGEVLFLNETALELLVGGLAGGDAPVWASELFVDDERPPGPRTIPDRPPARRTGAPPPASARRQPIPGGPRHRLSGAGYGRAARRGHGHLLEGEPALSG
jgi:hypothetical protein